MGLVITAYPPGREASGNPTKEKNSKNIWNVQETDGVSFEVTAGGDTIPPLSHNLDNRPGQRIREILDKSA